MASGTVSLAFGHGGRINGTVFRNVCGHERDIICIFVILQYTGIWNGGRIVGNGKPFVRDRISSFWNGDRFSGNEFGKFVVRDRISGLQNGGYLCGWNGIVFAYQCGFVVFRNYILVVVVFVTLPIVPQQWIWGIVAVCLRPIWTFAVTLCCCACVKQFFRIFSDH